MAEHSAIEWTDATWNVVTGCSVVSPGCTNCYAMRLAGTRLKHHPSREGLTVDTKAGPVWTGEVRFNREWLRQPLEWTRPRRIFVCAHGDLFADGVQTEWLDEIFAVMAIATQHTFQVLTKRPDRIRQYLADPTTEARVAVQMMELAPVGRKLDNPPVLRPGRAMAVSKWPLPNVWVGTSAEDQERANLRVPEVLAIPAAVRFVSLEPLLGGVRLTGLHEEGWSRIDALRGLSIHDRTESSDACTRPLKGKLDWVILGGESGPNARPMHPDWARDVLHDCLSAGVPFHFKQWGAWKVVYDRDRDDPDWRRCPKDDRHPNARYLNLAGGHGFHGARVVYIERVGKKEAGRLLDGRTWDELPEVAA